MDMPGGTMLQKNAQAQAQINTNVQQNKNEFYADRERKV